VRPAGVRRTGSARLDGILDSVLAREAARSGAVDGPVAPEGPARRDRFVAALRAPGLSVIAECKRRSPSAGAIGEVADVAALCRRYADGGAAALSILTERDHFGGAPDDLAAAEAAGLPRLRKDFVVTEAMIHEAAALGADAVLLIVACLEEPLLRDLAAAARARGLATLVEVHDASEVDAALAAAPDCVGVNARDLRTFEVDTASFERILPALPESVVRVAESGVRGPADAARAAVAGADAVLVGEALVRATDPAALISELRAAAGEVPRGV